MAINVPSFNAGADPFVRELEAMFSAQSQSDIRNRDESIRRAVVNFGTVPNFGGFAGAPQIDATTRGLADQATQQGVSVTARLQKQLNDAQRMIPKQLAARGALFSGETPYALGEAQTAFTNAQYDATRELIDYISGAMAAVAQREQERQMQLTTGRQDARLRSEQMAREDAFRAQDLALQQAANAASAGGGGFPDTGGGGGGYDSTGLTYTGQTTPEGLGIYTDQGGAQWIDTGQGFSPYGDGAGGPMGGTPSAGEIAAAKAVAKKAARFRTEQEKQLIQSFNQQYGPVSQF